MDGQHGWQGGEVFRKEDFFLISFIFFPKQSCQSPLHGGKQLDGPASPCPAVWITNEQTWHLSHHYKHLLKPVPPPKLQR